MPSWCECEQRMVEPSMCAGCDYMEPDPCEHEEYDSDILTGRATCADCGHTWWQSHDEIAAEIERIRAYDEWTHEQERPWYRFKQWARGLIPSLRWPRRRRRSAEIDDGIPF